jgi:antitoxin component of MazEF toxin-antitoxin module
MIGKIQSWGEGYGIRIYKKLLDIAHIDIDTPVEITAYEGMIIIEPATKVRRKYDLGELLKKMPKDYSVKEETWGTARGNEVFKDSA